MLDFKHPFSGSPSFDSAVCIDFGAGSTQAPASWNRVNVSDINEPVYLTQMTGEWSPVRITSMKGFLSCYNGVGSEPDKSIATGGFEFPKSVWTDALFVRGVSASADSSPASITMEGFDPASSYSLKILSVRYNGSADARVTDFCVKGIGTSEHKTVMPGMKSWPGDDADFSPYMVCFTGVRPSSDGRITAEVTAKATAVVCEGHISAMIIEKEQAQ